MSDGAEEFRYQFSIERTDLRRVKVKIVGQQAASAPVEGAGDQCLVHWDEGVAVACEARLVADGVSQGLSKRDADVFHGVVVVNVQVAGRLDTQVQQSMPGDVGEHVVEKADAGDDLAPAVAVQGDAQGDVRLRGLPGDVRLPGLLHGGIVPHGHGD